MEGRRLVRRAVRGASGGNLLHVNKSETGKEGRGVDRFRRLRSFLLLLSRCVGPSGAPKRRSTSERPDGFVPVPSHSPAGLRGLAEGAELARVVQSPRCPSPYPERPAGAAGPPRVDRMSHPSQPGQCGSATVQRRKRVSDQRREQSSTDESNSRNRRPAAGPEGLLRRADTDASTFRGRC